MSQLMPNAAVPTWQAKQNNNDTPFSAFHTPLALDAQYVFLLSKHMPELLSTHVAAKHEMVNITDAIYQGQYNTHSAAYSTLALGAFHQALATSSDLQKLDQSLRLQAVVKDELISLPFGDAQRAPFAFPFADYPVTAESLKLSIDNTANTQLDALYYVNVQAGYEQDLPSTAIKQGIEVERVFLNNEGAEVTEAKLGEELTVRIRMRSLDQPVIDNVAVVDLLPGGFSVLRSSIERGQKRHRLSWHAEHIQIKEDRLVYYGRLQSRMTEFTYKVKITTAGQFSIPPIVAESMYDRSLTGRSVASTISVIDD